MNYGNTFDLRLNNLIEKYGRRPDADSSFHPERSNNVDSISDDIINNYYFFYSKEPDELYSFIKDRDLAAERGKFIYYIVFFDIDIAIELRSILEDPELFNSPPHTTTGNLYFCINDLRIRYQQDKYHTPHIKRMLDFTEELFFERYNKINQMIDQGIINFPSLWYYLDKIDTIYKVKQFDEYIYFRHCAFDYRYDIKDCPLVLMGHIIFPIDNKLHLCCYDYDIKKFSGVKKISDLNIQSVNLSSDDFQSHVSYGNRILKLFDTITHMHLNGKQYFTKASSIVCCEKNEQVIIDYEGLEKYCNSPFNFSSFKTLSLDSLTDSDKSLLFPFVSLYNLNINKKWGVSHIRHLSPVKYQKDALDYLVLDQKKKHIIKSLISSKDSHHSLYSDFIKNKGQGLVFLLYGTSGTGKTFTAEAVTDFLGKPLYYVNIGDLGTDPEHMESIMNTILDYSNRWNAILLIDEADTFLETRENSSIIRNAMVGIFLRLLEYHQGIIFLTTNRLSTLDPAVKSRINLMLSYEDLDKQQRKQIWSSLLTKWNIIFDDKYIDQLSNFNLNGRDIRNYTRLVLSIHNSNSDSPISGKTFLVLLKDCFDLTEEFKNRLDSSHIYM